MRSFEHTNCVQDMSLSMEEVRMTHSRVHVSLHHVGSCCRPILERNKSELVQKLCALLNVEMRQLLLGDLA